MSPPQPLDPHHDGSALYVEDQLPELGAAVPVRVRVPHEADGSPGAATVVLRSVRDGEPHLALAEPEDSDDHGVWWRADLQVVNPLTSYRFLVSRGSDDYRWLNAAGLHGHDVTDAGDFKVSTEHRLPPWVADQVGYQIFPDRFARGANDVLTPPWADAADWDDPVVHRGPDVPFQWYGGTLDGITAKLDHLPGLGATMLYLTPVFEAWSNHRYDARSFDHVDPVLGGDGALERLITAAHAAGIKVMGDLTTNHTGDRHVWFERALADPTSVERGFYRIADDGSYASWLDIPSLPKLDHSSAELRRRLYDGDGSVVARWLEAGLDGWRIDVANMTGRLGPEDHAHDVARTIRRTMATVAQDAWLLAEHGHDATQDLTGGGWHGTMDYSGFTRPVWCWLNGGSATGTGTPHGLHYLGLPVDIPVLDGGSVVRTMRDVHAAMPWSSLVGSTLHLDTHDTPRFRTVTGGGTDGGVDTDGLGRERHLVGLGLQMTMPGVPVVFMGDELGLTAVDGEHARTPYPWTAPDTWDRATFDAYLAWIRLRRECVALRRGGLRWLHAAGDTMIYLREHPDQTLLVHANRTETEPVAIPVGAFDAGLTAVEVLVGAPAALTGDALVLPGTAGASVHVLRGR